MGQIGYERRFAPPLSSQSSMSEESSATRTEPHDRLSRAPTLSLSTPSAGTPPLSTSSVGTGRLDFGVRAETSPWMTRPPPVNQGTGPSTGLTGDSWREGRLEGARAAHQPSSVSMPHAGGVPISQLIDSDRITDPGFSRMQRTLPPIRAQPQASGSSPGFPTFGGVGSNLQREQSNIPNPATQTTTSLNPSENEAASTLADLARRPSPGDSRKASDYEKRRQ